MGLLNMLFILTPLLVAGVLIIDTLVRLHRNYQAARTIGVPIRIIPISPLNPFWALLDRKILAYLRRLPFGDNSFTRYNWRGWEVKDRFQSHKEMGDIWVLVTPFKNWIYINDPESLMSVFRRGTDFTRPAFINEMLEVFGPNISTAQGIRWRKQRKVATRCFNEQNNALVWAESAILATDMLAYWTSKESVSSTANDLRTLSLSVLAAAGFGKSFKFQGHDEQKQLADSSSNYKESLQTVLENLILILGLGTNFLSKPWLPVKFRKVHEACVSFQKHMTDVYEAEKQLLQQGQESGSSLMTLLIRASQDEDQSEGGLTEKEVYGNMFTFNFAGHDTTAHTFTFAMLFLAADPGVQEWLSQEIRAVLGDRPPHEWDYRTSFPRLKRCLSVMYETLRLYTVVPTIKWTGDKQQAIEVGGKSLILPPNSMIAPSYGSVQTDPRFWGSDSLEWRPSRWIKAAVSSGDEEEFNMPVRGAFMGWSEGNRDCPGRKFSQVEFVATMAVLFRDWRVDPVQKQGETLEAARQRALDAVSNDSGYVLLLQLLHPERVPLTWSKRRT
ncbi:Phomenoic acid biosynthesis cluster cytochrome P450 monooxygenase [Paramyrothecium foliicola]|nr:Phomenoic acid biosynthesis cluster cytochrome P450 monooxygenase [Paramyrothecium foliicola]